MTAFRSYPLTQPLIINDRKFTELIISSHYEKEHSSYMTDEIIKILIQQLDKKTFNYKLKGNLLKNKLLIEWQSFSWEPIFYENKAYRLVWYWESNQNSIWVLNCFRRKKYDKK